MVEYSQCNLRPSHVVCLWTGISHHIVVHRFVSIEGDVLNLHVCHICLKMDTLLLTNDYKAL